MSDSYFVSGLMAVGHHCECWGDEVMDCMAYGLQGVPPIPCLATEGSQIIFLFFSRYNCGGQLMAPVLRFHLKTEIKPHCIQRWHQTRYSHNPRI